MHNARCPRDCPGHGIDCNGNCFPRRDLRPDIRPRSEAGARGLALNSRVHKNVYAATPTRGTGSDMNWLNEVLQNTDKIAQLSREVGGKSEE